MKLWPVHKQGVLGFGKAVEKMIQCLNNTLYTSAVVLRLKEQKVMIKKLGLALLTSAIASMSMASVESVQANLKKNYPNINVQNIQKTEMSGIYSGSLDGEIVYLGEAAEHVIAGSLLATYGGRLLGLYSEGSAAGFIASVIGAIVILFIYNMITKKT